MKYAEQAPWDEAMAEMLSAHLGPACEATGLEPDAIFEIIGDHWQGPLWGCFFEDLLTQELEPDGGNLVDDYLKRRGWNERRRTKPICAHYAIRSCRSMKSAKWFPANR